MCASWQALHEGLERSIRTLTADRNFQELQELDAVLRRFSTPDAVVEFLTGVVDAGDSERLDEKDAVLAALVGLSRQRAFASLAISLLCLGLWPGLEAVHREARRMRGRDEDVAGEMLAEFSEVVRRLDLGGVTRVASTLVRNTKRRLKEELARERGRVEDHAHVADAAAVSARARSGTLRAGHAEEDSEPWEGSPRVSPEDQLEDARQLDRVVRHWRALLGDSAELAIRVFLQDEDQRAVAQAMGLSHSALRKRLQRIRDVLKNSPGLDVTLRRSRPRLS